MISYKIEKPCLDNQKDRWKQKLVRPKAKLWSSNDCCFTKTDGLMLYIQCTVYIRTFLLEIMI